MHNLELIISLQSILCGVALYYALKAWRVAMLFQESYLDAVVEAIKMQIAETKKAEEGQTALEEQNQALDKKVDVLREDLKSLGSCHNSLACDVRDILTRHPELRPRSESEADQEKK